MQFHQTHHTQNIMNMIILINLCRESSYNSDLEVIRQTHTALNMFYQFEINHHFPFTHHPHFIRKNPKIIYNPFSEHKSANLMKEHGTRIE